MVRRRRWVIAAWIALTVFGAYAVGQVSNRWFESFSIPGYSAYEANQRTLDAFGTGAQAPLVLVFHSAGDITKKTGIKGAIDAAAGVNPALASRRSGRRVAACTSPRTGTPRSPRLSAGTPTFSSSVHIDQVRAKLKAATPEGVQSSLTGRDAIYAASSGGSSGPSVLTEALIGGLVVSSSSSSCSGRCRRC
jgi:hypothetical protein